MPELFKVPKFTGKDFYEETHKVYEAVLKAAFPDFKVGDGWREHVDGVEVASITEGSWHTHFIGIQLKVSRYSYSGRYSRSPTKRVMMGKKDRLIDLEAIRSKHTELVEVAKTMKESSDKVNAAANSRSSKVEALTSELKLRQWFPLRSGTEDVYSVELRSLTADDVRALVLLLRGRGVQDVQETEQQ